MNKLKTLVALFLITGFTGVYAQTEGSTSAVQQYSMLENKIEKSNKDLENPKKTANPKYWLSRATVLMDAYEVNLKHLYVGAQPFLLDFQFGNPKKKKTETVDGKMYEISVYERVTVKYFNGALESFEETKPIHENPLPVALEAIEKAEEADADNKQTKKIKEAYSRLSLLLDQNARELFVREDYNGAFNNFEQAVVIGQKEVMEGQIDTTSIFNAGMAASRAGDDDASIKYYELALSYDYPEPSLYIFLKNKYISKGDSAKGLETLTAGFDKYPDNNDLVIELINYYLATNKGEQALEYIKIAQSKDPENVSLVFAEATLYDRQGEVEKAITTYERCLEVDPEYFNAYYNMGVVYYNHAQSFYDKASEAPDNEYKALLDQGDAELAKAIGPMEKCAEMMEAKSELSSDEQEALSIVYETLKATNMRL
jgi:tetratricopeptide (TPR) repeat protein